MDEIFNLKQSNLETLKKLQNKSLEILIYFKEFCEEHDLLFYFCGGCCIGAIRHNGFIPWDDDIDVFMPREDYEKLELLWTQYADTNRYIYCRTSKEMNFHHTATSIKDNNTTFINEHSKNENTVHGIGIEILPLDGCPNSKFKRAKQMFFAMSFSLFNAQRLPDNQGRIIRSLSKIILSILPSEKLRYKIWTYSEKQMSKYRIEDCNYITELVAGLKYMKLRYPKKIFEKAIYKKFEGYKLPVPIGYDQYLKMAFGDYMTLPPEEDRLPRHNTVYINIDKSYENYKGIYYCVEKTTNSR